MANLCGRQRVYRVPQVRHGSLAHLLLVRDRGDDEFPGLLLDDGEWRNLRLLCMRLAVDAVPSEGCQYSEQER